MVRRSVLVYNLLRSERPINGLSEKEILERISEKYNITAGKALRRQIAVALRRGMDFGILKKRFNKYRFQPNFVCESISLSAGVTRRRRTTRRKRVTQKKKPGRGKDRRGRKERPGGRKTVPKPKLPQPSSWLPVRRELRKENVPRVVKHS